MTKKTVYERVEEHLQGLHLQLFFLYSMENIYLTCYFLLVFFLSILILSILSFPVAVISIIGAALILFLFFHLILSSVCKLQKEIQNRLTNLKATLHNINSAKAQIEKIEKEGFSSDFTPEHLKQLAADLSFRVKAAEKIMDAPLSDLPSSPAFLISFLKLRANSRFRHKFKTSPPPFSS